MKNRAILHSIISIFVTSTWGGVAFADAPEILWDSTFGGSGFDLGRSVQQTSDGGFIVLGDTQSYGAGGFDFWLIRTGSDGKELWNKTFGGSGTDRGYSVQQTSDGGFILAGETGS